MAMGSHLQGSSVAVFVNRPEIKWPCPLGDKSAARNPYGLSAQVFFHIVLRGVCQLVTEGTADVALAEGDIALVGRGQEHTIRTTEEVWTRGLSADGGTAVLCGDLYLQHADSLRFPPLLIQRANEHEQAMELVRLIRHELEGGEVGAVDLASELVRVLLLMSLRRYLREDMPQLAPAAYGDARLLRALSAIRSDLAREWSLDSLADIAGASRATLVRLFRRGVGEGPYKFLTSLRITSARARIEASDEPLAAIAEEVGYRSEAAFSRAYRRRFGVAPREHRLTAVRITIPTS